MARFAELNQHDQSGKVWISTIVMAVATTLIFLLRIAIRWKMLGFDDGAAGMAQLMAYGDVVSVTFALLQGFAKSRDYTGAMIHLAYGKVSTIE